VVEVVVVVVVVSTTVGTPGGGVVVVVVVVVVESVVVGDGSVTEVEKLASVKSVSRSSKKYEAAARLGVVVPSHVPNVVVPSTQIASRSFEFQLKDKPRSENAVPLRAGALVGRSWTVTPFPLAFAATLLAGAIGQVTPLGSQIPLFVGAAVRANETIESLNVLPKLAVESVDAASRSKTIDQEKTSPVTIDAPTVEVAVAVPSISRVVGGTASARRDPKELIASPRINRAIPKRRELRIAVWGRTTEGGELAVGGITE
jgi:hypothetical protein